MQTLLDLLPIFGPSGDEAAIADWLERQLADLPGVQTRRLGDSLIAVRGKPRTAVFTHIDTVGWTLGYDRKLIAIGAPEGRDGDALRSSDGWTGRLRVRGGDGDDRHPACELRKARDPDGRKAEPAPGTRWIYDRPARLDSEAISSPFLDNRAGVWAGLKALERCENVAVAFTTGEETHGHGARVCANSLYQTENVTQALIADLTWHTPETPVGSGVVISLRDANCPRQAYLDRVLALADESGVPYQRELQDAGSSDGGYLLRSTVPMDWVFIGAPEKRPHTSREKAALADLDGMRDLVVYLVDRL